MLMCNQFCCVFHVLNAKKYTNILSMLSDELMFAMYESTSPKVFFDVAKLALFGIF